MSLQQKVMFTYSFINNNNSSHSRTHTQELTLFSLKTYLSFSPVKMIGERHHSSPLVSVNITCTCTYTYSP